jgi:hypothetical protein
MKTALKILRFVFLSVLTGLVLLATNNIALATSVVQNREEEE